MDKIHDLNKQNIGNSNLKVDKETNHIEALEILNLNVKKQASKHQSLTYEEVINIHERTDDETDAIYTVLLNTIQNTEKTKQPMNVWLQLLECSRNIGKKYHNDPNRYFGAFRAFTLKAYPEKQRAKCDKDITRFWEKQYDNANVAIADETKSNKIGLIWLQNIARIFDKEVYLKNICAIAFKFLYCLNAKKLGFDEYIINDVSERLVFKEEFIKKYKTIIVNLNTGEGKTEATNLLSLNYDYYLCLSNRRLYAVDLVSKIQSLYSGSIDKKSVMSYLNDDNTPRDLKYFTLEDTSSFVVSFESISKFFNFISKEVIEKGKTLCIFLDEIEALYDSIVGTTNKNTEATLQTFIIIWKYASIKILADAFLSRTAINLYQTFNDLAGIKETPLFIHANNRNLYPKTYNIRLLAKGKEERTVAEQIIAIDMKKHIKNGEKVAMFCEYANIIELLKQSLTDFKVAPEVILAVTAKLREDATPEELQEMLHYLKVPNDLTKKLVFMYNTAILNGYSFTQTHFTKGMMVIGDFNVASNDAMNAGSRIRPLYTYDVYTLLIYQSKFSALIRHPINDIKVHNQICNRDIAIYSANNDEYDMSKINMVNKCLKYVDDGIMKMCKAYNDGEYIVFSNFIDEQYNEVYKIPLHEYVEMSEKGALYKNKFIIAINKLQNFKTKYANIHTVFKYEIFKSLIKKYNNILIEDDHNIVEQYKISKNIQDDADADVEDDDVEDEAIPKKKTTRLEAFQDYIDKNKALNEYGTYSVKSCYDILSDPKYEGKNSYFTCNNIFNNFKQIEDITVSHLWALCDCSRVYKDIVNNIISVKYSKNREEGDIKKNTSFHYKYIKDLLDVLGITIYELKDFKLTTLDIKQKGLYNKLKDIANMSRRFYKREIDTRCTSKGTIDKSPLMCVRDINEILSPLNVCIEAPKYEKPLKKRMPDKSQLNIYTYQIQPKATPTISYNTSLTVMINTLHILAMLVKPEQYFDEVIEEDEEATTKYAFIPE